MKYRCAECDTWLDLDEFFTYKNNLPMKTCKRCTCQGVNPSDESSFLWILEDLEVPYHPEEWNLLKLQFPRHLVMREYLKRFGQKN